MSAREFEFGLDTPAFVTIDESGQPLDGDVVIRNAIEEAILAKAVGIDSFNIGEHYRPGMDSAGHVMLAAIAGRTVVRPDDEAAGSNGRTGRQRRSRQHRGG